MFQMFDALIFLKYEHLVELVQALDLPVFIFQLVVFNGNFLQLLEQLPFLLLPIFNLLLQQIVLSSQIFIFISKIFLQPGIAGN